MKHRTESNGSKVNDWATPNYILKSIEKEFGSFYDPCPLNANFDGLSKENKWADVNYINPPYERKLKEQFIIRAYQESKNNKICIMLLPASTDTKIFHDIIVPNAEIRLIRGRIKFKGYNTKGIYVTGKSGQTGSMICIFGTNIQTIKAVNLKQEGTKR